MGGREWALRLCLALSALIHLMPLPGVLGARQLQSFYALSAMDGSTELLLQHRALVFVLMGLMLLCALRLRSWRAPAMALVLASDIAFLVLALMAGKLSAALLTVAITDTVSIIALVIAAWLIRARPGGIADPY